MSILSQFKKDRLFQYQSKFQDGDTKYFESVYYLIKVVEYDDDNKPVKVITDHIIDVRNYLELKTQHEKIEKVFTKDFPEHIVANVKIYEKLLD